jgi:hypothetical protein
MILILVILAIVGFVFIASRSGEEAALPNRAPGPIALGCGGSPTTLAAATIQMPFQLELPDTDLASLSTIEEVLICAPDQVEIDFSSGVIETLGVNHLADPTAEWEGLAKQYPEFSTGTVRGVPASLADPTKGALGGVDLVEQGVRMTVTGNGSIPLADLIEVMESMAPIGSSTPTPTIVSPS